MSFDFLWQLYMYISPYFALLESMENPFFRVLVLESIRNHTLEQDEPNPPHNFLLESIGNHTFELCSSKVWLPILSSGAVFLATNHCQNQVFQISSFNVPPQIFSDSKRRRKIKFANSRVLWIKVEKEEKRILGFLFIKWSRLVLSITYKCGQNFSYGQNYFQGVKYGHFRLNSL